MLPNGWKRKSVGDIFDVQLGKMLNKEAKEEYPQYCYLGNSNVLWGYFSTDNLNKMYFSEKEKIKFRLKRNDILMCEGGEVGRCAIWKEEHSNVFFQKAIHRLRSKGTICPTFFQNFMQSISGTKLLDDYTTRTSIAHLTREKLLAIPVPLPPLPEQKKIAAILSTWDRAIEGTEKLLANSQQQKKALMQQLLTGKKRLPGFMGEWKPHSLSELAVMSSGGTPLSTQKDYFGGNIPWVSIADMTRCGKYISQTEKTLTKSGLDNSSAKIYPKNTVLYAMYASIGECSIASTELSCSQAILGIRTNSKLYFEYLYFYLSFLKEKIKLLGQTGTQSNLNAKMVKAFRINLPPIPEQKAIAAVLSTADEEITAIESDLSRLRQEKKALMQQLLTGKRRVKVD